MNDLVFIVILCFLMTVWLTSKDTVDRHLVYIFYWTWHFIYFIRIQIVYIIYIVEKLVYLWFDLLFTKRRLWKIYLFLSSLQGGNNFKWPNLKKNAILSCLVVKFIYKVLFVNVSFSSIRYFLFPLRMQF